MLCVKMYAVCRSHLCIVNVREYEVQDTLPLQLLPLCLFLRPILKIWRIWGNADEDHLGKSFQAMDFGLECQHDRTTASVNLTHRIGFRMLKLFRKIGEDFGGSIS